MTARFTCITCRVAFQDAENQRNHYKTDWHRYNLKRKVADIPPVTVDEYNQRVVTQREKEQANTQEVLVYCNACRKSFTNQNAFDNHVNSKKHKLNTKDGSDIEGTSQGPSVVTKKPADQERPEPKIDDDYETDSEVEELDSDEWEDDWEDEDNPISNNNCLFCSHHSADLLKNLKHMSLAHTFFLPDPEYLSDVKGLLMYLGEKVCADYMCIWCNDRGRTFYSAEAAKQHMIDKGHCKMLFEGEALAEYSDFYDYSKSYPDADGNAEEEVDIPVIDDGDYQLKLPSGATIGHRSLFIYYRQNFNPNRQLAVPQKKMNRILSSYRALGWSDTDKVAAVKKARDIHFMKRVQSKHAMALGVKGNKLQQHFRPQVNF